MSAYIIGTVTITDPSWVETYIPAVQAQVESHGGRYLARSTEIEKLEGDGPAPTVSVVLEFPSLDAARTWYGSSEYAPYMKARQAGSKGTLLLMDGL